MQTLAVFATSAYWLAIGMIVGEILRRVDTMRYGGQQIWAR